jgi:hypothetical protein
VLLALGAGLWLAVGLGFRLPAGGAAVGPPSPARALLLHALLAVPGAVLAAGFIALDQDRAAPAAYLAALAGAVAALGALTWLLRRTPQILNCFRGF